MRPLAVPLAVIALLAVPAAAPAKEISSVTVCGAGGKCAKVDRKHDKNLMALAESAAASEAPGKAAPFYRVRFGIREPGVKTEHHWTVAWVPSMNLIGSNDGSGSWMWSEAGTEQAARLRGLAEGIDLLPARKLRGWEEPAAQVAETIPGPDDPAPAAATSTTPWGWIAGGALALLAAVALTARARTTRTSGRRVPRPSGQRSA